MIDMIDISKQAHATALSKGWYDANRPVELPKRLDPEVRRYIERLEQRNVGEALMLICTEVTEALIDYECGDIKLRFDERAKPIGLPSELADVVIRIGDLLGYLGIELDPEIDVDYPSVEDAFLDMFSSASHSCEMARGGAPIHGGLRRIVLACEWVSKELGVDLTGAIEAKMAYNATRPRKHGKAF